jgi:DNA-binding CsgD family transcriptional regulator
MNASLAALTKDADLLPGLANWQRATADIIAHLDAESLPAVLDRSLESLVQFDQTVIFAYPDQAQPLYLHDGFRGHAPGAALDNYVKGAYLLDPFYTACTQRIEPGLYRISDLAPDHFFEGEYFNSWQVHPCISMESGSLAEEIGFVVPLAGGFMLVYSLMRRNGNVPFSAAEVSLLRLVEPVIRQALSHHWRHLRTTPPEPTAQPAWSMRGSVMELAFESFGAAHLSPREQVVVQLILRGHSTTSIAQNLAIAEGTVKNHRKSIYAKLKISSQQELFHQFITHMLS